MNVFQKAALAEKAFENYFENIGSGYQRITTFYSDLTIAEEVSGAEGVKDTYRRVVKSWINDYKYFTEFVMCLNLKSWEHHANGKEDLGQIYSDLYYEARDKFYEHYEGNDEATSYFFKTTD